MVQEKTRNDGPTATIPAAGGVPGNSAADAEPVWGGSAPTNERPWSNRRTLTAVIAAVAIAAAGTVVIYAATGSEPANQMRPGGMGGPPGMGGPGASQNGSGPPGGSGGMGAPPAGSGNLGGQSGHPGR